MKTFLRYEMETVFYIVLGAMFLLFTVGCIGLLVHYPEINSTDELTADVETAISLNT